jgi:hypothetical protein
MNSRKMILKEAFGVDNTKEKYNEADGLGEEMGGTENLTNFPIYNKWWTEEDGIEMGSVCPILTI